VATNERVLTLALLGLGLYFSVLLARGLLGYLRFRRVRPTALLTWRPYRPGHFHVLLLLGAVAAAVAVVNALQSRPFHHVYSQASIAAYFVVMVPLSLRIQQGFYRDGVWADAGFLPYTDIGRLAFVETPEIVLVLMPRRGTPPFRLRVPPSEYGAVRKILDEKARAALLHTEPTLPGL
jgi:hypothetical protein